MSWNQASSATMEVGGHGGHCVERAGQAGVTGPAPAPSPGAGAEVRSSQKLGEDSDRKCVPSTALKGTGAEAPADGPVLLTHSSAQSLPTSGEVGRGGALLQVFLRHLL